MKSISVATAQLHPTARLFAAVKRVFSSMVSMGYRNRLHKLHDSPFSLSPSLSRDSLSIHTTSLSLWNKYNDAVDDGKCMKEKEKTPLWRLHLSSSRAVDDFGGSQLYGKAGAASSAVVVPDPCYTDVLKCDVVPDTGALLCHNGVSVKLSSWSETRWTI